MLSMVLQTVVSQQMLPDKNGGMVPAFEIMHTNNAIRSMIRDNKNHQISNVIAASQNEGMITMDQAILELYKSGHITKETALDYADAPDMLRRQL
jgi:twitching motility protein PilT